MHITRSGVRTWAVLLGGLFWCQALALARGAESSAEHRPTGKLDGVLRTTDGRMFVGVRALRPDPDGLTFRHDRGAARVAWDRLSAADAKRFGAPDTEPEAPRSAPAPAKAAEPQGAPPVAAPWSVDFRFRTTVIFPDRGCPWTAGEPYLPAIGWPAYWARPGLGLAYPFFPWRQLAERDFLITTGILPRPSRVITRRLSPGRF